MRATAIALIALAIVVGACGGGATDDDGGAGPGATPPAGSATDAPGGAGLDPCALVAAADVEGVLGEPAQAGIDDSTGDLFACSWKGANDPTEAMSISIYVHPDAATAREQYLATTEGLDGVDILNLGDEALYFESFGLRVLAGRYDLAVDNTGPDEKASDLRIAQQVLAALP